MSFNKKRVPALDELTKNHIELGDEYLNQFELCDVLTGSPESIEYLNNFFKKEDELVKILNLLTEARDKMSGKMSSKYIEEFNDLQKVINSINNKLCITSQK